LENDVLFEAVPSTRWWTSLLVQNRGASNGLYLNPLRSSFTGTGVEITNPGEGFVQFWMNAGLQTIAQFSIALQDLVLRPSNLSASYTTRVLSHSDNAITVAMRNPSSLVDQTVLTYAQGSPYVFAEFYDKSTPVIDVGSAGVSGVEFYTLSGTKITESPYTGDGVIIKMIARHIGYQPAPPSGVGAAILADRFFLVNTPTQTVFTIAGNRLSMNLGEGNYLSVAAIQTMGEAAFYHQHGYTRIVRSSTDFAIDHENSLVHTYYRTNTQSFQDAEEPVLALLPHQYRNSDVSTTSYQFRTVRGTLKMMVGKTFDTLLSFRGMLPSFAISAPETLDTNAILSQLETIATQTNPADLENFYNDEAPYWNSKALYPLAQGMIIADQIGSEHYLTLFKTRLFDLLADWYTYSGSTDEKYLYYNQAWGSVYYSNNDFNTASELSDHAFTHGYLIYASAVLAFYDETFQTSYGDMVDLLLNDYLFPEKGDATFAYLRSFDAWAGHSWAHGFGTFAEGNNLESTGEALNSWVGGYLWGLARNDQARIDAAIYGFATELASVKEYWFDYHQTNWNPAYSQYAAVAGMVWGGKFDYATWFGANPTFIYGIQWLPTGEYLTNYALNDFEYGRLQTIFNKYLQAKNQIIDTWFTNMWAMQAILNPIQAASAFNLSKVLADDYPAEAAGSYWMIQALNILGRRTDQIWAVSNQGVASTVYQKDGAIVAMVWNPANEARTITFRNADGIVLETTVPARTFDAIALN
jgi:endoglucanase Acf2